MTDSTVFKKSHHPSQKNSFSLSKPRQRDSYQASFIILSIFQPQYRNSTQPPPNKPTRQPSFNQNPTMSSVPLHSPIPSTSPDQTPISQPPRIHPAPESPNECSLKLRFRPRSRSQRSPWSRSRLETSADAKRSRDGTGKDRGVERPVERGGAVDAGRGEGRSLVGGAGELRGVSWGGCRGWEGMNE